MNDYVRPIMKRYLSRIEDRLKDEDVRARLHIVRSDGGLMSASGPQNGRFTPSFPARPAALRPLS